MSFNSLAICPDNENNHQPLIGLATLMSLFYSGSDLSAIGKQLLALAADDDAEALLDLSTLVQLKGDHDTGIALQNQALLLKQHFKLTPENIKNNIKLLAILAPGDLMANTPMEFLAEGASIHLEMLYVSPDHPLPDVLPEHDIAMVAVSELDRNYPVLTMLQQVLPKWPKPLINQPSAIVKMARDRTSQMLQNVPGINMPITTRINRQNLTAIANNAETIKDYLQNNDFPFIIRPIDSHAGQGLERILNCNDITEYLNKQNEDVFFISPFVDYHSADLKYRKYRIVLMNGKPFVAHMAVSDHWMIHYLNAGMTESAEKRAEEEYAMLSFDTNFAQRHAKAFQEIHQRIGLEYIGIDCGETLEGDLLVFEIGNSMVVHAMDPVDLFPYKQPQMSKVFAGFYQLLTNSIEQFNEEKPFTVLNGNSEEHTINI